MSVPRGRGDRRPCRVLDEARDRRRGAFPRVLEGPSHARALVLPSAGGQATGRLRRHVRVIFDSFIRRECDTGRGGYFPMAKLQLTDLEIYVKDLKAARAFYTKKIGLKGRYLVLRRGYLSSGATKCGCIADL